MGKSIGVDARLEYFRSIVRERTCFLHFFLPAMPHLITRVLNRLSRARQSPHKLFSKQSYSQCGEDLIVKYIFDKIGIPKPSYLDIGAFHPYNISNTALFYRLGFRGINIEPDPVLFKAFLKHRPEDINLNVGISTDEAELDFFMLNVPTLNTFSKKEAENYALEGDLFVKDVKKIKVLPVQTILDKHFQGQFPHFLSLDAEGIDELVIKSIDFETAYPLVICVETISFSNTGRGQKNTEMIDFLRSKGYIAYADTYINNIFVREDRWLR